MYLKKRKKNLFCKVTLTNQKIKQGGGGEHIKTTPLISCKWFHDSITKHSK